MINKNEFKKNSKLEIVIFLILIPFSIFGQTLPNNSFDSLNLDEVTPAGQFVVGNGYNMSNAPFGNLNYWNVLSMRHGNSSNYFTTQLAGEFYGNRLAFRNTKNTLNTTWNEIYHSGNINDLKDALGQPLAGYKLNDILMNGSEAYTSMKFNYSNNLGIEWSYNSDLAKLYYTNPLNGKGKLMLDIGDDNSPDQGFQIRGVRYDGVINEVAYFQSDGNVGIGTTTPQEKLSVNGNISSNGNITSSLYSNEGGSITLKNTLKTNANTANRWTIYNMTGQYGNSLQFWNYSLDGSMYGSRFTISDDGNVGIGTSTPKERLSVNGKIRAREVNVEASNWPDYVFKPNYKLLSLAETEKYVKEKGYLPGLPSARDVEKNGIELGVMNKLLLKKIEELTLLLIEQNKRIEKLEKK